MDKTLKPQSTRNSVETQTDTIKTKLCKDVEVDNQADLVSPVDQSTETEIDYIATKSADGKREHFFFVICAVDYRLIFFFATHFSNRDSNVGCEHR